MKDMGTPEKKETYLVSARKYRPSSFKEILAQEAIVQTLKNALASGNIGQAYLFSGPRGTGKTTLARLFAKSLNCANLSKEFEPCNACPSCLEITSGYSLDVLEMDGASNRGIEDIRQINETVLYAPSCGKYKIYLIDEVHMLTKEAFNALLKTLEEPPKHVKFFFATTESHKIPSTILSRCQKFFLKRIPVEKIVQKLSFIAEKENVNIGESALRLIAKQAEGAFRDGESLFDQIRSFEKGEISEESVRTALGIPQDSLLFDLTEAILAQDLLFAFKLTETLYVNGFDLTYFIQMMELHFRALLRFKLRDLSASLYWNEGEKKLAEKAIHTLSKDTLLKALDYSIELEQKIKASIDPWITLEHTLLKMIKLPEKRSLDEIALLLKALQNEPPKTDSIEIKKSESQVVTQKEPSFEEVSFFEPKRVIAKPEKLIEKPSNATILPPIEKGSYAEEMGARPLPSVGKSDEIFSKKTKNRIDTLLQFAAVEWDASIERS